MAIEFEIKIEIKIDKKKYEAVKSTQGCEGCVALSDPELCGFLSITLANETYGGLSENNSGNINEIKRLKQDNICDIFRLVFVQPEQEQRQEPESWIKTNGKEPSDWEDYEYVWTHWKSGKISLDEAWGCWKWDEITHWMPASIKEPSKPSMTG